jgi:hypothetical protein
MAATDYDDSLLVIDANLAGMTNDDLDAGPKYLPVGDHVCECVRVKGERKHADKRSYPRALITWKCLTGEHKGMVTTDFQELPGDGINEHVEKRLYRLLNVCGLVGAGEAKQLDMTVLVGARVVLTIEEGEEYEDRKTGEKKRGNPRVAFFGGYRVPNDGELAGVEATGTNDYDGI